MSHLHIAPPCRYRYALLYLHMPLKLSVTVASAAMRHAMCTGPGCGRGAAAVLVVGCGAALGLLAVLHLLSADRNLRRAGIRAVAGALLASLALLQLPARAALEATVA